MSLVQEQPKKKTRRRLRVSCVECTRRRQASLSIMPDGDLSRIDHLNRNATGSSHVAYANPAELSISVDGNWSRLPDLPQLVPQQVSKDMSPRRKSTGKCSMNLSVQVSMHPTNIIPKTCRKWYNSVDLTSGQSLNRLSPVPLIKKSRRRQLLWLNYR